eukprot:scaffold49954_cov22-Tisochrysis_lutea.AAC.3
MCSLNAHPDATDAILTLNTHLSISSMVLGSYRTSLAHHASSSAKREGSSSNLHVVASVIVCFGCAACKRLQTPFLSCACVPTPRLQRLPDHPMRPRPGPLGTGAHGFGGSVRQPCGTEREHGRGVNPSGSGSSGSAFGGWWCK